MPYKNPQSQKDYYQRNKEKLKLRASNNYKENRADRMEKSKKHYQKIRHLVVTGEGKGHGKGKQFIKGFTPWNKGMGNPSENHKIRTSLEYTLWRKKCFERDNFTCQISGEYGGELVIHHMNNFADFPELRTLSENGITLTKRIHKAFHKKYGVRDNTKEQLKEFSDELFFNPEKTIVIHT